jgi:predicted membrane-bound mannosyltransferase
MLIGAVGLGIIAIAEASKTHGPDAALAFHHMTKGAFARNYWIGLVLSVAVAIAAAVMVLFGAPVPVGAVGGIAAMIGVWLVDDAFVRAGQSVPLT